MITAPGADRKAAADTLRRIVAALPPQTERDAVTAAGLDLAAATLDAVTSTP